ncbi:AAA family ATPase [Fusibacter sp. 3D3]|uniref:AAA family ATPase n=1 Tax=Fusibacter sp. 3D3 TaxID=1048380 RepID=UPI000852FA2E|nr:ATP-binding protein [Fusibacter sp. 3D3]GAU76586.1 putative ATP binding protein SugR [Fusibacter sp. 3D3]
MKLEYVYLNGYKNLNELEIYFEEGSTVNSIIGNNGSGKSNILEALSVIFSTALNDGTSIDFRFCIKYVIDDNKFKINNADDQILVSKNGEKVSKKDVVFALPKMIFLYYSGETKRLKQFSDESIDKRFDKILKKDEEIALKYMTYLTVDDFGASLLTSYIYNTEIFKKICDIVDIKEICTPIMINLKKPKWSKTGKSNDFWGAIGTVGKELNSLAQKGIYSIIDNNKSKIIIEDIEALKDETIGAIGLFTIFKVLDQADVIDNIEFDVIKGNDKFSYKSLSEGEKQLAQLLSVLEITKDYKALFLLDEFDSYLHPNWQRQFVDILSEIDIRGQVLFTTHSPLTLGKMSKENIIILKDGNAYNPAVDTFNRDVSEVLEEIMEVGKRPSEVEKAIKEFRNTAVHGKYEDAIHGYDILKSILSKDDPFFITAEHLLARLKMK